ncbi:MAG TPA: polysaccharide biosynthesis/export family protein [Xanthobacteraceae bacterium]
MPAGSVPRGGPSAACTLLAACLLCSVTPARAEYHLDVGDVIEISVARAPELQRRVSIGLDGSISFPLLGTVALAGLAPAQAQAKIKAALANKIFQIRTSDGRNNDVVIAPDEVTATVAEYRPIYVNGDVSKPGEYPYRLLMTARQAVALSGGYDTVRFRMSNPVLDLADLKSEYQSHWIEFAKERAHVWRLKAELGDANNSDQKLLADAPLPPSQLAEIVRLETENLGARQADHQRQKEFLQRAIKQGSDQIDALSEQQQREEQGVQADAQELQKDLDLLSKGTLISPRVTDARRAVLLSSTRKLQTVVQLMQLRKQQDEVKRKLEQLDDQRRIELLGELQEAGVKLGELRAKLQGIEEKVRYTSVLKSQLAQGASSGPEIAIIRKSEKGLLRLDAIEETELQPGDVVEVAVHRTAATQ